MGKLGKAVHIFSSRGPSQKLSKPVPTHGFVCKPKTKRQISVRPVSVGSFPNAATIPPPESKNRAVTAMPSTARTSKCTTAGLREGRLANHITTPAETSPVMEVVELHWLSSHIIIARIVP